MIPFGALTAIWTQMNMRRKEEQKEDDFLKPWDQHPREMSNFALHLHLFIIGVIIGVMIWLAITS